MNRPQIRPGTIETHPVRGWVVDVGVLAVLMLVVGASAIVTKELMSRGGDSVLPAAEIDGEGVASGQTALGTLVISDPLAESDESPAGEPALEASSLVDDLSVRWFNGRAIRPVRTMMMTVTAYSPDARSCGGSADNVTSSLHNVHTNGFRLVAADSRVLPLGSMVSIPGYDADRVVPVLDRGGKIKGARLDVLFPTHEEARRWGVKRLAITVWEYADGQGAENWRRIRDSKP